MWIGLVDSGCLDLVLGQLFFLPGPRIGSNAKYRRKEDRFAPPGLNRNPGNPWVVGGLTPHPPMSGVLTHQQALLCSREPPPTHSRLQVYLAFGGGSWNAGAAKCRQLGDVLYRELQHWQAGTDSGDLMGEVCACSMFMCAFFYVCAWFLLVRVCVYVRVWPPSKILIQD